MLIDEKPTFPERTERVIYERRRPRYAIQYRQGFAGAWITDRTTDDRDKSLAVAQSLGDRLDADVRVIDRSGE